MKIQISRVLLGAIVIFFILSLSVKANEYNGFVVKDKMQIETIDSEVYKLQIMNEKNKEIEIIVTKEEYDSTKVGSILSFSFEKMSLNQEIFEDENQYKDEYKDKYEDKNEDKYEDFNELLNRFSNILFFVASFVIAILLFGIAILQLLS